MATRSQVIIPIILVLILTTIIVLAVVIPILTAKSKVQIDVYYDVRGSSSRSFILKLSNNYDEISGLIKLKLVPFNSKNEGYKFRCTDVEEEECWLNMFHTFHVCALSRLPLDKAFSFITSTILVWNTRVGKYNIPYLLDMLKKINDTISSDSVYSCYKSQEGVKLIFEAQNKTNFLKRQIHDFSAPTIIFNEKYSFENNKMALQGDLVGLIKQLHRDLNA